MQLTPKAFERTMTSYTVLNVNPNVWHWIIEQKSTTNSIFNCHHLQAKILRLWPRTETVCKHSLIHPKLLTALLVLMSIFCLRYSKTLSRLPALAALRNEVFPSDCKKIMLLLFSIDFLPTPKDTCYGPVMFRNIPLTYALSKSLV